MTEETTPQENADEVQAQVAKDAAPAAVTETKPAEEAPAEGKPTGEGNQRVFKIGSTRIVADESMAGKTNREVRDMLKAQYPEIAHANIREKTENGTTLVEFSVRPGHKG